MLGRKSIGAARIQRIVAELNAISKGLEVKNSTI
jgi:hypothetical protein